VVFTAALLAACDECGRRLYFFVSVRDAQGAAIGGSTVEVSCRDAGDGAVLAGGGTANARGEAVAWVQALNRACPDDEQAHASYFASCVLVARADGYAERTMAFTGAMLDALPRSEAAGNAGHGVRVEVVLSREP
jgi:hypothetical protein